MIYIELFDRLDYRKTWDEAFRSYLTKLKEEKHVVLCGDLNVAHNEIGAEIEIWIVWRLHLIVKASHLLRVY